MSLEIVYIDDEKDLCELFKMLLLGNEYKVHTFHDCIKGVEYINNNNVDILFIDYRMPCMNGFECREKIEKDIPIYLVTGELQILVPDNFAGTIDKPIDYELIKLIIEEKALIKTA